MSVDLLPKDLSDWKPQEEENVEVGEKEWAKL